MIWLVLGTYGKTIVRKLQTALAFVICGFIQKNIMIDKKRIGDIMIYGDILGVSLVVAFIITIAHIIWTEAHMAL